MWKEGRSDVVGERAGEKNILGNEREWKRRRQERVRGVKVSAGQAETITSAGCLFLTHWANLIEAKHLKSSGNVADPPPVQHAHTTAAPHKQSVFQGFL